MKFKYSEPNVFGTNRTCSSKEKKWLVDLNDMYKVDETLLASWHTFNSQSPGGKIKSYLVHAKTLRDPPPPHTHTFKALPVLVMAVKYVPVIIDFCIVKKCAGWIFLSFLTSCLIS